MSEENNQQEELKRGYDWMFVATDNGQEKVQGKMVDIDIPNFDFFVIGEKSEWYIAEFETGTIITSGDKTQKEAKKTAYYTVKQNPKVFKEAIMEANKINKY